jgi:hypothetical protein
MQVNAGASDDAGAFNAAPCGALDAAPFARPLDQGTGLCWEDPRELHRIVVHFKGPVPAGLTVEYWRARWPHRRLPKGRLPEGGESGWWELGDWFTGEWQVADTTLSVQDRTAFLDFRPACDVEFPDLPSFEARYRTTLKIRLTAPGHLPEPEAIEAYTDSTWDRQSVTVLWNQQPRPEPSFAAFNGYVDAARWLSANKCVLAVRRTRNPDPNTFDRTLLTVGGGKTTTILVDDLVSGPIYVPDHGIVFVEGVVEGDFAAICSELLIRSPLGIYDAVARLPEQTWSRAWQNMVPKRKPLYLPLGTDGGRHRFGLNADGSVFYRTNNRYLVRCPGRDTERLQADPGRIDVSFGLPETYTQRTLVDGVLPVGVTRWDVGQVQIQQEAFATLLEGTDAQGAPPAGDALGVLMARFECQNLSDRAAAARLALHFLVDHESERAAVDQDCLIWSAGRLRGAVDAGAKVDVRVDGDEIVCSATLAPQEQCALVVKLPYVLLRGAEVDQLRALGFEVEREAVIGYWRRRLGEGMKLYTPEPMLDEFHKAHAAHLLINCERAPDGQRRFARVGSFHYGAYGNESCMMIVDLDRRGYHREARECLEAFLRGQGTVALPGDFDSQEGVFYGASGYEAGGYNQHHGWIMWCLVEHFKFTRDEGWLRGIVPNLVAGADWIIRQRGRTSQGLLPHGSLEDIGDWWQWLSTNAYTWRGLDAAAWALEQAGRRDAAHIRADADAYRAAMLRAFTRASERAPVVRLRDGTCVPHFPSYVRRRGRCFGWIRETLEGALHLLIAGVLDPHFEAASWIIRDYEDNLYLSEHYGYQVADWEKHWFDWGGFSMQACLLLDVEPYLYRDEVKHALRAAFNAIAAGYYPDTRMLTEHALPRLGDWRGDHFKSSDEANAAGWLRYMFLREAGEELLVGQAIPAAWLQPGHKAGVEGAHTHFGPMSVLYEGDETGIVAALQGLRRNPPSRIRLRFRRAENERARSVMVNGRPWPDYDDRWVYLPGDIGDAEIRADF